MSNLANYPRHVQYTAFYECLDRELEQKLRMAVPDHTNLPVLAEQQDPEDDEIIIDEQTLLSELENIFRTLNPIHARRQAFFEAKQKNG